MQMRTNLLLSILAILAVGCPATAEVIYSDFGAGQTFSTTFGAPVANVGLAFQSSEAVEFTPSTTTELNSITLAFFSQQGPNIFNFAVAEDESGVPGSAIESWSDVVAGTEPDSTLLLNSSSNPILLSGQAYWITALPGASGTVGDWDENIIGQMNGIAISSDLGAVWTGNISGTTLTFEVDGTAVPTPTSFWASAALFGVLLYLKSAFRAKIEV
jgi:hypothetical protein